MRVAMAAKFLVALAMTSSVICGYAVCTSFSTRTSGNCKCLFTTGRVTLDAYSAEWWMVLCNVPLWPGCESQEKLNCQQSSNMQVWAAPLNSYSPSPCSSVSTVADNVSTVGNSVSNTFSNSSKNVSTFTTATSEIRSRKSAVGRNMR